MIPNYLQHSQAIIYTPNHHNGQNSMNPFCRFAKNFPKFQGLDIVQMTTTMLSVVDSIG